MPPEKIYDIIGIGIGPFNLGLAALAAELPELNSLFIDQQPSFNWHPGMMIAGSRLQVPFYADLVTLAHPQSPYSYLCFLKAKQRMFRFAISEQYFIKRTEFNEYCQWVCGQLPSLQFGTTCNYIEKDGSFYRVKTNKGNFLAQKLVLGVGTLPFIPDLDIKIHESVFHSSAYLDYKQKILNNESITIVGSGQSAAEIFYDLLQCYEGCLHLFTRSVRFMPMDYSKLSLELSTPDYIDHFYSIPERKKASVLKGQDELYKGINQQLISDIYNALVEKDSDKVKLHPNCELIKVAGNSLTFLHKELEKTFTHDTNTVILATGYKQVVPNCIKPIRHLLQLDAAGNYRANRNYSIDENNSVFIQNAEMVTHGFNASDLSLGPYRNAVILNSILGREEFNMEKRITFQRFGIS